MKKYTATVEVANRQSHEEVDVLGAIDKLIGFDGAVGQHPRGWWSATVTVEAETLTQATTIAVALVEAAYGCEALSCEVMPTREWTARQGWPGELPELVSVAEAAMALGISRQRVLQKINEKTLPAEKVGATWVIPAAAVRRSPTP